MKWLDAIFRRLRPRPKPAPVFEGCTVVNSLRLHTFLDQYIDLTDKRVENCTFDGCVVELRPGQAAVLNNSFRCCELVGKGWPPEMLAENERVNRPR